MTGNNGAVQGNDRPAVKPKSHDSGRERTSYPRRSGASNSRSPISAIKERLTSAHIEALCRSWLPDGKKQGGWYVCCCPWRDDRNPSFGVSLQTGIWKDFASGEKGDMIDLSMRLFNDSLQDTIKGFCEMLGMQDA